MYGMWSLVILTSNYTWNEIYADKYDYQGNVIEDNSDLRDALN